MGDEALDFLEQPATSEQQPAAPAAAVTEETPAPVTEGSGQPVQPEAPEAPEVKPEQHTVPLSTFLDMRDKLKRAEARNAELEPDPNEVQMPDPVKDPTGYQQFRDQQVSFAILNDRMNFSEKLARKEHGAELVDKVRDWALERFEHDEDFTRRVMNDADPYEAAIQEYNREQLLTEVGNPDEIAAFRAWKAAQANGGKPAADAKPQAAAQPAAKPAAAAKPQPQAAAKPAHVAPKSLVDAPGTGGAHAIPVGEGNAFDSVFK